MTEERLSRRSRRAQQETPQADPAAEFAALVQAGEVPEIGPDGQALSRRERRRLERVVHPVEIWTAEEEMLATGQIPALTPEVIAEQERLAREKAAQSQAEAVAASAEMRLVAAAEARPERLAEVTGQLNQVPVAVPEPVSPLPVDPTPAVVVPEASGQQHTVVDAVVTEEPMEEAAEPAPQVPVLDDPSPDPHPIPASLRHLFPPGSLQARAFEEQEAQAEPEPVEHDDAAAEIRRLADEAMASLARAAHEEPVAVSEPATEVASGSVPQHVTEAVPDTGGLSPFQEALAAAEAAVAAATPVDLGEHTVTIAHTEGPDATVHDAVTEVILLSDNAELQPASVAIPVVALEPAVEPVAVPSPWEEHPLDSAPTPTIDVNAYTPVVDLPTPDLAALQQAQANPFAPVGSQAPMTPHPFGQPPFTQPFGAPQAQSALFPGQPLTGQTPIFPGAMNGANPVTGAIPLVNGAAPTMPGQLVTGAIPTVNREARLQEAGGVRHYRWVHFVVLGALMFVFGVVVYQVMIRMS